MASSRSGRFNPSQAHQIRHTPPAGPAMSSGSSSSDWYEDYGDNEDDFDVNEYDLSVTPNDFNVSTLFNFIESEAIIIPGFQRHYVWDINKASKLIESLILGLPVPQLFLYEKRRNRFLVIDGQQRLMSIYYFIKQRFPRKDRRAALRLISGETSAIPDHILHDDRYFTNFRLQLSAKLPDQPNPLSKLSYETLGGHKFQFDLRPIRNVVVKQNSPENDDSSIYEIFSRLNSGGVNLKPQEIRTSLYHSKFYDELVQMNADIRWREILGRPQPDLHMKDVEVLLRIFAILIDAENYSPSMVRFLNQFSRKCQENDPEKNQYLRMLFDSFLGAAETLPKQSFINKGNNRFNIALIEAVFNAASCEAFEENRMLNGQLDSEALQMLSADRDFVNSSSYGTTQTSNVRIRLERGKKFIKAL